MLITVSSTKLMEYCLKIHATTQASPSFKLRSLLQAKAIMSWQLCKIKNYHAYIMKKLRKLDTKSYFGFLMFHVFLYCDVSDSLVLSSGDHIVDICFFDYILDQSSFKTMNIMMLCRHKNAIFNLKKLSEQKHDFKTMPRGNSSQSFSSEYLKISGRHAFICKHD